MNPLFFLPLLVLALWAIQVASAKHYAALAMLERLAVVLDYDDLLDAHHQALLGEYETNC